jgi:hypothetical protein
MSPDIVWHAALIIYYSSWVAGTLFDTDMQELAYREFPRRGKWPGHAIAVVIILSAVAAALCWAEGDIKRFSVVLVLFIIVDHGAWRYLIWYLGPSVRKTELAYQESSDFLSLEILHVVVHQIQGNWKWWRLIVSLPTAGLICAFAFLVPIRLSFLEAINYLVPGLSANSATAIVASLLVIFWVLAVETWHWIIRVRTKISIEFLYQLSERYALRPL